MASMSSWCSELAAEPPGRSRPCVRTLTMTPVYRSLVEQRHHARAKERIPMSGQFVVTRGGRDTFCSEDDLKSMAKKGLLGPGDLVYHPTLGRWLYAREVEEVRELVAAAETLGRPPGPVQVLPSNGEAIAGFIFGILGYVPLLGFLCCLLGIYFSS